MPNLCLERRARFARILEVRPEQTSRRGGGGSRFRNTDWRIKKSRTDNLLFFLTGRVTEGGPVFV